MPSTCPQRPTDPPSPWRITPWSTGRPACPLHGVIASRAAEAEALARQGAGGPGLMTLAGAATARLVRALWPHAQRVTVYAGPGHNGGDALWAAVHLARAGWAVDAVAAFDEPRLPPACAQAWQAAQAAGVCRQSTDAAHGTADPGATVLIDGLLDLGSRRRPEGRLSQAIRALNRRRSAGGWTLALDLPSGLHPDSGQVLGDEVVQADATLQFLTLKPGPFTGSGRACSGDVWFDPLDRTAWSAQPPSAWLAGDVLRSSTAPDSHKGRQGDVRVVGGARGMGGAALLAARAAQAAGAGRVLLHALDADAAMLAPGTLALMTDTADGAPPTDGWQASTVVAGCGGGLAIAERLPDLLARAPRLVLDADGLNAVARDAELQHALANRAARGQATVLTPHPKEASRLLAVEVPQVQDDRLLAARQLADRFRCTVVLKGSGSVVAAPGLPPVVIATGNGALATAGTGDVLAGWLAGLWAPRVAVTTDDTALQQLAVAAAASHGAAADQWQRAGHHGPLTADRLVDALALR